MSDDQEPRGIVIELLLREPEIVAWLEDYRRPQPDEAPDDDTPAAA